MHHYIWTSRKKFLKLWIKNININDIFQFHAALYCRSWMSIQGDSPFFLWWIAKCIKIYYICINFLFPTISSRKTSYNIMWDLIPCFDQDFSECVIPQDCEIVSVLDMMAIIWKRKKKETSVICLNLMSSLTCKFVPKLSFLFWSKKVSLLLCMQNSSIF